LASPDQDSVEKKRAGISCQSWDARGCERGGRTDCDGDRSKEGLEPEGSLANHGFTNTITMAGQDER